MKLYKSKTINFNALMAAGLGIAAALGFDIPPAISNAVLIIGNWILRLVTKEPISAK